MCVVEYVPMSIWLLCGIDTVAMLLGRGGMSRMTSSKPGLEKKGVRGGKHASLHNEKWKDKLKDLNKPLRKSQRTLPSEGYGRSELGEDASEQKEEVKSARVPEKGSLEVPACTTDAETADRAVAKTAILSCLYITILIQHN